MEAIGPISEAEWSYFDAICSDEADFMPQLLNNCSNLNEYPISPNTACWLSQDSDFTTTLADENLVLSANDANPNNLYSFATVDYYSVMEPKANQSQLVNDVMEGDLNKDDRLDVLHGDQFKEDGIMNSSPLLETSKKRARCNGAFQRSKRSGKKKKSVEEENNNSKTNSLLNSNCSENKSQESSEETSKKRANRCSATDSQSLYAKKRRERINERLRILQTLVPNGTKVDISTMLEEAVQYVKFLQLQIKLLISDELWMYAPIAYNGMGLGL